MKRKTRSCCGICPSDLSHICRIAAAADVPEVNDISLLCDHNAAAGGSWQAGLMQQSNSNGNSEVLSACQDVVLHIDAAQGTILSVNAACYKTLGFRPAEMVGRNFYDFMEMTSHEKVSPRVTRTIRLYDEELSQVLRGCIVGKGFLGHAEAFVPAAVVAYQCMAADISIPSRLLQYWQTLSDLATPL